MSGDEARFERLIGLAERLIEALEGDIAAIERGRPQEMRTLDPEVQKLSALYAREAQGMTPAQARAVPPELSRRLTATTGRFTRTLTQHRRVLTRVRNASEGIIKAVADEVERRRAPMRPYGRSPAPQPRPASAMLYNKVI